MSRRPRSEGRERGFFLVWMAIMLITLMATAALAIEWNNLSRVGVRMQKAADAASLGGAVFLPGNEDNQAFVVAAEVARKNGFVDGVDQTIVRVSLGSRPNQLQVEIQRTVPNVMGRLLGNGTQTISRRALAEYERPVAMGSPINQYGNDPVDGAAGTPTYPNFWANVAGPASHKPKGDAIAANICPTPHQNTDNCAGGTNTDYDQLGYYYGIEVTDNDASEPLNLEVFDAGFVHVGDNCGNNANPGDGFPSSNLLGASQLPPDFNPTAFPGGAPFSPSERYAPEASSPFCTGDMYFTEADATPPWTTYRLLAPDDTPADPTNNEEVCAVDFPGRVGDVAAMLGETVPAPDAPGLLAEYFRQWYPICGPGGVAPAETGIYYLQVTTASRADGVAAPLGGGHNRFAIRAGLGSPTDGSGVSVFGEQKMGMYANAPSTDSTFYLARLLPSGANRTLVLRLYDIGDASQPGTLRVLPPDDGTIGGIPMTEFSNCTFTQPPGNATGPPFGTLTATAPGCALINVSSSNYNGQWVEVRIPVPDGYACDLDGGCWTRINFTFPANIADTTTWTASIEGDPVRLLE